MATALPGGQPLPSDQQVGQRSPRVRRTQNPPEDLAAPDLFRPAPAQVAPGGGGHHKMYDADDREQNFVGLALFHLINLSGAADTLSERAAGYSAVGFVSRWLRGRTADRAPATERS